MLRAAIFARVAAGAGFVLAGCGSSSDGAPEPAHPCPPAAAAICEEQVAQGAIPAEQRATCEQEQLRACSTQHYFRGYPERNQPACLSAGSTKTVNQNLLAALFHGGKLWDDRVVEQTHGVQRYWAGHELWFYADRPSERVPYTNAMVGSDAEFRAALSKAGIDPEASYLTPEQEAIANQAVGEVMFRPLREMIASHQAPGRVNIFILPEVVAPVLAKSISLQGEIAGIGVSPALFARIHADDPQFDLLTLMGLPPDFTPSLFVGSDTVRKYTNLPDNLVAHEMGHILGLVHQDVTGNLMTQGTPTDCRTTVTDQQIDGLVLPRILHREPGWLTLARSPERVRAALRKP